MMPTHPRVFPRSARPPALRGKSCGRSPRGDSPRVGDRTLEVRSSGRTGLHVARGRQSNSWVVVAMVDGGRSLARPVRSVRPIVERPLSGPSAPTGAAPLPDSGPALAAGPGLGPRHGRNGQAVGHRSHRVQVPATWGTSVAGFTRTGMAHAVRAFDHGADHQAGPDDPTLTTAQMPARDRVARWSA
jgi:hypothetical protein